MADHGAGEGGLAGAEIARQRDQVAGRERGGDVHHQPARGFFVGERHREAVGAGSGGEHRIIRPGGRDVIDGGGGRGPDEGVSGRQAGWIRSVTETAPTFPSRPGTTSSLVWPSPPIVNGAPSANPRSSLPPSSLRCSTDLDAHQIKRASRCARAPQGDGEEKRRPASPSEIPAVDVERTPGRARWRRHFTRGRGPAEHDLAGGAELPLVFGQALRHPRLVGNGVLAKPERVRRAGIRILLRVGDGRQRRYDRR